MMLLFRILRTTAFESSAVLGFWPSLVFFNMWMVILLVLHVYWFSLIVRVAYAALTKEGEVINALYAGTFFLLFLSSANFSKSTFSKNSFRNMIRVSNSLDLDLG